MKQVKAYVISNDNILGGGPHRGGQALGGYIIQLRCPEIASEAKPGHFVMVRCGDTVVLPRPFSIHQATDNTISLFFAVVGKGTNWLSQRKAGDEVDILGPSGNGFSIQPGAKNLLLIAGGMGLAPLYFLAQQVITEKRSVTLLLGAAISPLYPRNLLPSEIKFVPATDDGSVGYHGMVIDLVPDFTDWADQIFACGPMPMYKAMAKMAELKGKSVQVSLETVMGCGRGICYGCTIKTRRGLKEVCSDGPVFDLDDILWEE